MIEVEKVITQDDIKVDVVTNAVIKKGFSPYIKDDYWYEYDESTKAFVNTGILAKGQQGNTGATGPQGPQGEVGPQGPQGVQGEKGDNYNLTETDKQEIAQIVLAEFPVAEEVSF